MNDEQFDRAITRALEQSLPPFSPHVKARALGEMARLQPRSWVVSRSKMLSTVIVALAILAAIMVPGRGRGADAFAVLAAAAQAAEQAHSIRIVRGLTDRVPSGLTLNFTMSGWGGPHTDERVIAAGPRSIRRLDIRDGTLNSYFAADADTAEYAVYVQREKTLYTADLRPLQPIATQVVAHTAESTWKSESFEEQLALLGQVVADKAMQQSVTDGVYRAVQPMQVWMGGGKPKTQSYVMARKCQVVTISWTVAKTPKLITSRVEFYLAPDTHRPFAERQYLKIAGQREKLIGDMKIEYDVPFPPRDRIPFPLGTKVVPGTARTVDTRNRYGHAIAIELLEGQRLVAVSHVHLSD